MTDSVTEEPLIYTSLNLKILFTYNEFLEIIHYYVYLVKIKFVVFKK